MDARRSFTDYSAARHVFAPLGPLTMDKIIPSRTAGLAADESALVSVSAVAWRAIFAGAFVAVAATLVLGALGSGFGFAAVSPWEARGVSATTFAVSTAIWLIVTQWVSSGLGGYIAGRLRTRWAGTHVHEVFFRDTAHGLVTWGVASVAVVAVVVTGTASLGAAGVHSATQVAAAGAQGAMSTPAIPSSAYGIDKLFRSAASTPQGQGNDDPRLVATHILANGYATGNVPDTDRAYLADLVAARTGVSSTEAKTRVDDFIGNAMDAETKAKAAADRARKSAAEALIYTALSMLVGAFISSVAAAIGGRLRDEHP